MIDNYKDLTLGKFLDLRAVDYTAEDIDIQVEIISILSDEDEDTILNLPIAEYKSRARKTAFLGEQPKPVERIPKSIKVNGREYRVVQDAREFITSQYIDYQNLISDVENLESRLPQLMTIFLIPKDAKCYNEGYDLDMVMQDSRDIGIEIVLGLARFFFRQSQRSINRTLTYLEWTTKRMRKREKRPEVTEKMEAAERRLHLLRNLLNDGDGFLG